MTKEENRQSQWKKGKSKGGKRWGSKWTRGEEGWSSPTRGDANNSINGTFCTTCKFTTSLVNVFSLLLKAVRNIMSVDQRTRHTHPFLWLHMSHNGINAVSTSSVSVLGIWFWRVITVDTAHLNTQHVTFWTGLRLSTAAAPLVSLRQLYGTVCLLTSLTLHH